MPLSQHKSVFSVVMPESFDGRSVHLLHFTLDLVHFTICECLESIMQQESYVTFSYFLELSLLRKLLGWLVKDVPLNLE